MMMIVKGTRITARWLTADPETLKEGARGQLEVAAKDTVVSGIVRHIRVSTPEATYPEALFIDPDPGWDGATVRPPRCTCPNEHVLVKPDWIIYAEGSR